MATIRNFFVIDPDREVRSLFQRILESMGYSFVTLQETNESALEQMVQRQTHFLIINWRLTPMPGMVFLQKVRQSPKFRFVPTVILSKQMAGPDLRLATELGLKSILPVGADPADIKKAISALIEAEEKLHPDFVKLRAAAQLVMEGKSDEALPLLAECHKSMPKSPEAARLLGEVLSNREDWQAAEVVIEPAHIANEADVNLAQILAKIYSRTGRQKEAIQLLGQLSEYSPLNISTLLGLGQAFEQDGNAEKAKAAFSQARTLDPDDAEASSGLGRIAVGEGKYEEALQYFKDPKSNGEIVRIFNNSGVAAVHKGDLPRAFECYRAAISMLVDNPNLYRVRYNLGLALRSQGELLEAFNVFVECIETPIAEKAYASLRRVSQELEKAGQIVDKAKLHAAGVKIMSLRGKAGS